MTVRDEAALAVLTATTGANGQKIRPLIERFQEKHAVDLDTGCWVWVASAKTRGYGAVTVSHEHGTMLAHRLSYLIHVGRIPDGMELDHLCRNRACVNPEHLEPVTTAENGRRARPFRQKPTHCPQGHAYAEHGRLYPSGQSYICLPCKAEYTRRRRAGLPTKRRDDRLPDDVIRSIRTERSNGVKLSVLAARYGITETSVSRVARRLNYPDVD
jgi:hypothetical protein